MTQRLPDGEPWRGAPQLDSNLAPSPGGEASTSARQSRFADTADRYGTVSRCFHWVMAYLIVWQCLMFVGWRVLGEAMMRKAALFGPSHSTVGLLVLVLILPRALWVLLHRARSPGGSPPLGRVAYTAHAMLYVLMFVIPVIALLRAYGSGKGLMLGTLRLVPATGQEIRALTAPADLLHAPLGWTLAVLVSGHIAIALIHHFADRNGSLHRMAGRARDGTGDGGGSNF